MKKDALDLISSQVVRKTLAQQVEEQIIELLISNKLKPGDKLPPEMELMELLGVSRPVMREAMTSLESLGIVKRKTRDGTYFTESISNKPFSTMLSLVSDNIEAIVEARTSLELGLVTYAAEKMTDETLEALNDTIIKMENSVDNEYGEHDLMFHRIIALSVNNPVLQGMIDSLLLSHVKINAQIKYREKEKTIRHHKAIYEALKKKDPQAAFQAMYNHLKFVEGKVLE
ncbi:FadR/GntR family transcriptional regulator [Cytobacillus sp. FSL R5-0569]|uniref:FadR/GntR family transcriptional regulator n=1 Tax=Cytobacillus sp. FSL R5-0569 TaxID=2921649 RepID=UPI0030F7CF3F